MKHFNLKPTGSCSRFNIKVAMWFASLLAVLMAGPAAAADIFVDDDSSCTTACGTAAAPFAGLQQAIDAAVDGDVIRVQAGDYPAGNVLTKSVSIVGEGSPRIIVGSRETGLIVYNGHGMELSGLTFTVPATGALYSSGLSISQGTYNSIDQVTVSNNSFEGLFNGSNVTLNEGVVTYDGNNFSGNTNGLSISLRYYTISKKITVTNNNFTGNTTAIGGGASPQAEKLYVYHNNFIDNANQTMPSGAQVPGYLTGGNYWSHLTPSDINMDGVIDQPYGYDSYPVIAANGWQQISPVYSIHNRTWGVSYASLAVAIAEAVEGDVIELDGGDITAAGKYYEPVVIDKRMTLRSSTGAVATLHPSHNRSAIHIGAADVTVQGLKFKGLDLPAERYPVGVTIGVAIYGNTFENVNLTENHFDGLYHGLQFTQSKGSITVDNNLFTGNDHGLYFDMRYYTQAKTLTITNNRFETNTTAIRGGASPNAEKLYIYHNNFVNNDNQAMPRGGQVPGYATGGNYWSNLVVEDFNLDGVIDQPYGTDFYPVTKESGWTEIVPVKAIHNRTQGISYSSLIEAIQQAFDNDLIELEGGEITGQGRYYETISISKPVTIRAMDISAQLHPVHDQPAIRIYGSDVTIDGFTIAFYPNTNRYPVGIAVIGASYTGVQVINNHINNLYHGIQFSMNSGSIVVDGNTLDSNTTGIYFSLRYYTSAKSIQVTENSLINNGTAISGGASPNAEKVYVYNNNFISNANQRMPSGSQPVSFDTGGNHWSNHTSPDLMSGSGQDVAGSDGIVDVGYDADAYPYVEPNGWQFQNTAPNANLVATAQVILGEPALFDASSSWDAEGDLAAFEFHFGNDQFYREDAASALDGMFDGITSYIYPAAGAYETWVTVTDTHGAQSSAAAKVVVLSLADALGNLIQAIQAGGLKKGPENALVVKVKAAIKSLAAGDSLGAKQSLSDLMDQLQAVGFCNNQAPDGFCGDILPQVQRIWILL